MTAIPVRPPAKVGLIGAGNIAARHHLGYLAQRDRIRLVAVADPLPDRAAALVEPWQAPAYRTYEQMLAEAEIDAVDICLPHHLHAEAIITAARHGKHILCEKPLCLSLAEADRVTDAVTESGVTMMCLHNRLFSPVASKARELLADGLLGRIYEVRATDCFRLDVDPATLGWRTRLDSCGGGELIDTGYHPAYLIRELSGGVPQSVMAMTSRHRLSALEGEDSAQVLVRFDNGVVGHIATSWAYQPPATQEHFSVVGERGWMHSSRTHLTYQLADGDPVTFEYGKGDDIAAAIEHFADCLLEGRQPLHDHRDGAQVLAMILAAYQSAETGTAAPVRPVAAATGTVA
jgi:predicted dehydrogenase